MDAGDDRIFLSQSWEAWKGIDVDETSGVPGVLDRSVAVVQVVEIEPIDDPGTDQPLPSVESVINRDS